MASTYSHKAAFKLQPQIIMLVVQRETYLMIVVGMGASMLSLQM